MIMHSNVHLPLIQCDMTHYVHYSLDCLRIVTFSKKAVEFRDNIPTCETQIKLKNVYFKIFFIFLSNYNHNRL